MSVKLRVVASLIVLWSVVSGCEPARSSQKLSSHTTQPPSSPAMPPQASNTASTSPLPASIWRGVCLAHSWQDDGQYGYGSEANAQTLDHLKSIGVQWLSVTPFGWMSSVHDVNVSGEHQGQMPGAGESAKRMVALAQQARERGFKLMLKPHIWIRGGQWRGHIAPRAQGAQGELVTDWESWWRSYREFILYYARQAQALKVEVLVMGVELVSALREDRDGAQLKRTIEAIREVYSGQLTYSANWDEELEPSRWAMLDYVSVQLYGPLSQAQTPTRQELVRALSQQLESWSALSQAADRPLLITEVGYKSAPSAVREPFAWPERLPPEERHPDEALQALAYEALFEALAKTPRLKGVFLWKYFTHAGSDEEGPMGFSPRAKPAEAVIRAAYALDEPKAAPSPAPP